MKAIDIISTNEKCINVLCSLYERWLDESEYEDIKDYANVFEKVVNNEGGNITGVVGTKIPFGFKFVMNGERHHVYAKCEGEYIKLYLKSPKK